MKLTRTKKAFTLIELLVVITIIGILATGWVAVFTTQIQWARDSNRISDIKILETAQHQIFNDNWAYSDETSFSGSIAPFISKILKDPKEWQKLCWRVNAGNNLSDQTCWGYYSVEDDTFWLTDWRFKLWVFFEKETNVNQKAKSTWRDTDWWSYDSMFEVYSWAGGTWVTIVVDEDWGISDWVLVY